MGALTSTNRAAGSTATCSVNGFGSYAILETCQPFQTCSGNGQCNFDGSCKCNLGWTGASCNVQYCDQVLFPCSGKKKCTCSAPAWDCKKACLASGNSASSCSKVCPATPRPYGISDCPLGVVGGKAVLRQTV